MKFESKNNTNNNDHDNKSNNDNNNNKNSSNKTMVIKEQIPWTQNATGEAHLRKHRSRSGLSTPTFCRMVLCLPAYTPELNPIEQFWSKVEYLIKREALLNSDTLSSRKSEACNMVTHNDLHGYIRHSIFRFDDCFNVNPIWYR